MKLPECTHELVVFSQLNQTENILGVSLRGKWGLDLHVAKISTIKDIVGTWSYPGKLHVYILRKHPGLDLLSALEAGRGGEGEDSDEDGEGEDS